MTDKPIHYDEIAHLPLPDRIDLVCDALERERRRGVVRPLDEYVRDVPTPEREAFLSELRTIEDALSNASTIMAGEETQSLAAPLGGHGERADGDAARPPEPTVPTQLGRYQVEQLLGRGGFGEVWRCFDPELQRHVAVKVLLRERFASDKEVARFLDEARKLAQLRHPGIVAVYDVGCQGGYVFLVSEYVPGGTLQDRLQKGSLPPAEAAELLAKVAEAVHYAHKKGLVHRDLKPSNILIDSDGQPRVADFGLAVHEDEQRRRAGEIAGTPAYMAPEQVRGESHLLDGRADIWAIGAVLYQSLTGRRPFNGGTREELFDEILRRPPRPLRQIDDRIPQHVEELCLACLNKEPSQRPSTAHDVARKLLATHDTLGNRRGTWLAMAATILAVAVAGFVFVISRPKGHDKNGAASQTPLIADVGKWISLHERPAQKIAFVSSNPYNFAAFDQDSGTYKLSSFGDVALIKFAELPSDRFEVTLIARIDGWVGFAGFFWGLRDAPPAASQRGKKCFALTVGRAAADAGAKLYLEEFSLTPTSGGVFRVSGRRSLWSRAVQLPEGMEPLHLTVKLLDSTVTVVELQGDKTSLPSVSLPPGDSPGETAGGCGLIGFQGSVVFEQSAVRLLPEGDLPD